MVKPKMKKERKNITSIQISKELKKELDTCGNKGDTYESIIKKLIQKWKGF